MVTIESCSGGGIAWCMTSLSGSSDWFDRALVTYSNTAKTELVGVPAELIQMHGAVSLETAAAMADGGLQGSNATWALSVTGVAGPGGGSEAKPVGTVCFGWANRNPGQPPTLMTEQCQFSGERQEIRIATIRHALRGLLCRMGKGSA